MQLEILLPNYLEVEPVKLQPKCSLVPAAQTVLSRTLPTHIEPDESNCSNDGLRKHSNQLDLNFNVFIQIKTKEELQSPPQSTNT